MDNLKILVGDSTFIPEMDEEEQENRYFESSTNYNASEIIDSIGTPEFKSVYINLIDGIRELDTRTQKAFCKNILIKIKDVYDYEFLPYPSFYLKQDLNNIYELLQFLEYDNIYFMSGIWIFLDDIATVNLEEYCTKNIEKILKEVEYQIDSNDFNELISIFLRTNNRENMIRFIVKSSESNKMLIKLNVMERRSDG